MTRREEKELASALDGFEKTGDHALDSMIAAADELTERFAVSTPTQPVGRAMFIEGVAARKRSFMSSLVVPGMGVVALLIIIVLFGRSALPGESLYPVRNVLRSAGLATAPTTELQAELEDARMLLTRARSEYERDQDEGERFVIAALMSLGRAEGYLDDVGAADRVTFESRIDALRTQAVSLIHIGDQLDDDARSGRDDDNSGSGSDDSDSDDDNSGPGSDGSDADDNSGSGSDDSGGDDDNSGSGSDNSGSGSDSSGSGSGSDDADDLEDRQDDLRDEQEDLREERSDD